MPKIIDPQERREQVATALFRVVRRDGFTGATLRNVAEEAGLAIGSVRHFLGSHEELLAFAFDTMVERVQGRVVARLEELSDDLADGSLSTDRRRTAVLEVLCELLPLDERRRDETVVWVEFETAARTDANLARRSARSAAGSARLVEQILAGAARHRALDPELDLDVEVARLAALVDGLTWRAALHPELLDPQLAKQVLAAHLDGLRVPA